jgi:hypothetical protein
VTESDAEASPLVLDATCLSHFARADRLDVLRDLLVGRRCWTTEIVLAELNRGVADYPLLGHVSGQEWLLNDALDSIAGIRLYDTDVHGTIWLLAGACRQGKLTPGGAGALIDALRSTGHRLPCPGAGFASYARQHGLL